MAFRDPARTHHPDCPRFRVSTETGNESEPVGSWSEGNPGVTPDHLKRTISVRRAGRTLAAGSRGTALASRGARSAHRPAKP